MLLTVEHEKEVIQLTRDVKEIRVSASFEIRNWASNSLILQEQLQEPSTAEKTLNGDSLVEKILGIWWDTTADHFTLKVSKRMDELLLSGDRRPAKQEVLRTLMMVFDSLGLIGHFLKFFFFVYFCS